MDDPSSDNPERWTRVAKVLLILTPFAACFTYWLSALQGADTRSCLIVSGASIAMCLGASLLYYLRGSKAAGDMAWIAVILRLLARR